MFYVTHLFTNKHFIAFLMEIKAYNDLIKVIIICKKGFH